jgi:hypothetical protein
MCLIKHEQGLVKESLFFLVGSCEGDKFTGNKVGTFFLKHPVCPEL